MLRTRKALGRALVQLMLERRFDDIKGAVEESGLGGDVYDLLTGHLAVMIERRMEVLDVRSSADELSGMVVSRTLAAALAELLRWWVARTRRPTALEMDDQFHEIVWRGLARCR